MRKIDDCYLFSPTDEFKDLRLDDYPEIVKAFGRRINGWFFRPLEKLLAKEENLFIASSVECMLVDTFCGFFKGLEKDTSNKDFKSFMIEQLDVPKDEAYAFYKRFRCGILHQTSIKEKSCISLDLENTSFYLQDGVLFFNPRYFYAVLKAYFDGYLAKLESDIDTEVNFRKRFKHLFKYEFAAEAWVNWNKPTSNKHRK